MNLDQSMRIATVSFIFIQQRDYHVHCAADPMVADPTKETTVNVNYLLGR